MGGSRRRWSEPLALAICRAPWRSVATSVPRVDSRPWGEPCPTRWRSPDRSFAAQRRLELLVDDHLGGTESHVQVAAHCRRAAAACAGGDYSRATPRHGAAGKRECGRAPCIARPMSRDRRTLHSAAAETSAAENGHASGIVSLRAALVPRCY